jgi:hypothetical protein
LYVSTQNVDDFELTLYELVEQEEQCKCSGENKPSPVDLLERRWRYDGDGDAGMRA